MGTPITWQNINAPSFADASRAMALAQQSITGAFDGLKTAVTDNEAFNKELWKRQDQEATQDALGKIYQAQSVDQFNALNQSGALDQATAANGARIDRAAINALRDGRVATLQNRDTQAITYRNAMLDDVQANDVRRINTLALTDPKAASAELAKNPDLRKSFEIAKNIDTQANTLEERQRAKDRFGFDQNEEAQKALLRPFAVKKAEDDLLNGPAQRAAQAAQANAANEQALTSKANRDRIDAEAEKARTLKQLGTALDGNIYKEGVYKDTDTVDLAKIMKEFSIGGKDEDAGNVRSDITQRLNKIARNGIKVIGPDGKETSETLPVPLGVVKAALLAATDSWGPDNYGTSFERELRTRLQNVSPIAPTKGFNVPPVMDPLGIMPGLGNKGAGQPGANKALDDWLNYKQIMRNSAENALASTVKKK